MKTLTIVLSDEYAEKLERCLKLTEREDDEDGFIKDIITHSVEDCLSIYGEE